MVLGVSQILNRQVDTILKLHLGKPEGSLDQTGGLPLQFRSQKILQEVGDLGGGWIQTEETELQNHLKCPD